MKRIGLTLGALALSAGVGYAAYSIDPLHLEYVPGSDTLIIETPCVPPQEQTTSASPVVINKRLYVFYNCANPYTGINLVRIRQYAVADVVVYPPVVLPPIVPTYTGLPENPNCPTARPGIGWVCQDGGWLPPGHPAIR